MKNLIKNIKNKKKIIYILLLIYSSFILFYAGYRSYNMTLSHDESVSYIRFINKPISALLDFDDAGNHFFNTIFSRFFSIIFGKSEFSLRLINLFALILYLIYSFLIVKRSKNIIITFASFIILTLNPYVLDFFSCFRGYGLAISFILPSIYYFIFYIKTKKNIFIYLSLFFSFCSYMSNLTFLNFFLSVNITFFIYFIIINKENISIKNKITLHKPKKFLFTIMISFFLFSVLLLLFLFIQNIIRKNIAEDIKIEIIGKYSDKQLDDIFVYRTPPRNDDDIIIDNKEEANVWILKRDYARKITIKLNNKNLISNLEEIKVTIGDKIFNSKIEIIKTEWKFVEDENYLKIELPTTISLNKSKITKIKEIINWKGDKTLISRTIFSTIIISTILLIITFMIYILINIFISFNIASTIQLKPLIIFLVTTFILLFFPVFNLKLVDAMWYGGRNNFISDTIYSLLQGFFYNINYFSKQYVISVIIIGFVFLIYFMLLFFSIKIKRLRIQKYFHLLIVFLILFFCFLSINIQFYLLKTPFAIYRTALFFTTIFTVFIVFLLEYFINISRISKYISYSIALLLSIFTIYHSTQTLNLTHFFEWKYDADTKQMLLDLNNIHKQNPDKNIKLGMYWFFNPATIYYKNEYKFDWLDVDFQRTKEEIEIFEQHNDYDYCYIINEKVLSDKKYSIIKRYKVSGNILVKME